MKSTMLLRAISRIKILLALRRYRPELHYMRGRQSERRE